MGKTIATLTFFWVIIIGAWMIGFTPHGPIVVCIACGSPLNNILGAVSIVLGLVGLVTTFAGGQAARM